MPNELNEAQMPTVPQEPAIVPQPQPKVVA